jgi:hypothetical protein
MITIVRGGVSAGRKQARDHQDSEKGRREVDSASHVAFLSTPAGAAEEMRVFHPGKAWDAGEANTRKRISLYCLLCSRLPHQPSPAIFIVGKPQANWPHVQAKKSDLPPNSRLRVDPRRETVEPANVEKPPTVYKAGTRYRLDSGTSKGNIERITVNSEAPLADCIDSILSRGRNEHQETTTRSRGRFASNLRLDTK